MLVGEAPIDLRTVDDCDVQNYDGYKQIPDPKSVSDGGFSDLDEMLNYMLDNQIDGGVRKMDDCHVQIDEGHNQIPDPKSPELEKTTDTEPEWTDESDMDSSDKGEILDEPDDQIDGDKQMLTDEGESRKRKRNASCCTCRPRRPAKTRKLALPEGFGYVPSASYVDENGVYQPVFTHQVAYMRCRRCGINGDHWEPFCLNPINDPPETEEEAAIKKISWKYLLRNFNPKEYLEKHKTQGKLQPSSRKAGISKSPVSRKCIHCRNQTPAKTEKPPLPEGFGYVPSASYVDEDGVYQPVFTHQVAYMRCRRCGINGDHWEPFCLNPINDPPETEEEAAKKKISWKYLLRNFNPKEYLEKHKTQEPEFDPPRLPELKFIGPKSRRAVFRLVFG